jgi:hypothetical protein
VTLILTAHDNHRPPWYFCGSRGLESRPGRSLPLAGRVLSVGRGSAAAPHVK